MSSSNTEIPAAGLIIEALKASMPDLYLVYVIGSRADGTARADSDYDVAFLSDSTYSQKEVFNFEGDLAVKLGCDVDLIDLRSATTVFQMIVVRDGKVLYCADQTKQSYFEMYTLAEYARLNERREELLKQFYQEPES